MWKAMTVPMNLTEPSDNHLLQLMLAGNREAFAELYRRRHANVYRFALQMSGLPEIAEDVTQEVFMLLMCKAEVYDERRGSVNAFLLGVARNHVLGRLKRDRPYVGIDEAGSSIDPAGPEKQWDEFSRSETVQTVQRAVLSLPAHYREVVVLCELQELSYIEAAAVLGCAVGTVRSRLHRARDLLIDRLRPENSESRKEKVLKEKLTSARCFA